MVFCSGTKHKSESLFLCFKYELQVRLVCSQHLLSWKHTNCVETLVYQKFLTIYGNFNCILVLVLLVVGVLSIMVSTISWNQRRDHQWSPKCLPILLVLFFIWFTWKRWGWAWIFRTLLWRCVTLNDKFFLFCFPVHIASFTEINIQSLSGAIEGSSSQPGERGNMVP